MRSEEICILHDGAETIGVELSQAQLDSFKVFTQELLRWNAKLNLTSIKKPVEIIARHYIDSLTICSFLPLGAKLLDIGSGGGFPAIPLKIARPDLAILSVDSVQKKINFQKQVARLLGFEDFTPLHARVEDLPPEYSGSFDFVVARAVADLVALAKLASTFLNKNGRLIAMKGSRWKEEVIDSERELACLGFSVTETRELTLPITGDGRGIVLFKCEKG